jgi:hypothetical protein
MEHGFVGNVVADRKRSAPPEWRLSQKGFDSLTFVSAGRPYLDDHLATLHRPTGADLREVPAHHRLDISLAFGSQAIMRSNRCPFVFNENTRKALGFKRYCALHLLKLERDRHVRDMPCRISPLGTVEAGDGEMKRGKQRIDER